MIVLQDKAGAPRISLHAMTPDAAATLGQAFAAIDELLRDPNALAAMRGKPNPYGDGLAGQRCAQAVAWRLGLAERPQDWQ